VFQEILHRYGAIHRREAIQPAFDLLSGIVDEIFPIEQQDLLMAKDIMLGHDRLSSRDAIHIAVMAHHGVSQIFTFDAGFDAYPGIHRISNRLALWSLFFYLLVGCFILEAAVEREKAVQEIYVHREFLKLVVTLWVIRDV